MSLRAEFEKLREQLDEAADKADKAMLEAMQSRECRKARIEDGKNTAYRTSASMIQSILQEHPDAAD